MNAGPKISEGARAILEARARVLARPPAAPPPPGEVYELVTFALGAERYALETRHVREVFRLVEFTPIPGAPAFLVGVTNWRGSVLAVVDLRTFFGVPVQGITDLSRVIVLGHEQAEFGVLADRTDTVLRLHETGILPPPESVVGIGREYLRGVTRDAMIVLDGAVLVQDPRLVIDQVEAVPT